MEKSLEVIGQLQVEKKDIVRRVYAVKNLDEVYRRQTELNAMGISGPAPAFNKNSTPLLLTIPISSPGERGRSPKLLSAAPCFSDRRLPTGRPSLPWAKTG